MDKDLIVSFLVKEAIKAKEDSKHRSRLWDAIRKANRDVMTGARTGNIPNYVRINKDGQNKSSEWLYQIIVDEKEPLCSKLLMDKLQTKDMQVEFSAIQKLVNMTLKYLIILNECESDKEKFDICEDKCECPIDSIILDRLKKINGNKHECWTRIKEREYNAVQYEIATYLKEIYPTKTRGNIWFDFREWKNDE